MIKTGFQLSAWELRSIVLRHFNLGFAGGGYCLLVREAKAALRCLQDVFLWLFLGAGSRLESVGEDDELTVENGESNYEIAVKYSRGGRKHSLPQQLESAGARQVSGKAEVAVSTSLCWVPWYLPVAHRSGRGS